MRTLATLLLLTFLAPIAPFASAQTIETGTVGELEVVKPNIRIQIPGLDKKELDTKGIVKGTGTGENGNGCEEGELCVQSIEIYLNAVYKFALSAGVIIAIVLVMIGGMQWMVGSTVGSNEKARERIEHAIIGLLLLFGTYAILAFINPNITSLAPLQLQIIPAVEHIAPSVLSGGDPVHMNFKKLISTNDLPDTAEYNQRSYPTDEVIIVTAEDKLIHNELVQPILQLAALQKTSMGKGIKIASAARSMELQIKLLVERCFGKSCSGSNEVCNPFKYATNPPITGSAKTGYKLNAAYKDKYETPAEIVDFLIEQANYVDKIACPHLTGSAVDLWCQGDSSIKANVRCHQQLEFNAKSLNLCRIYNEGWHFELKSMANSPDAKACDAPIGRVEAPDKMCASTTTIVKDTPRDLYHKETLGQKTYCLFDYARCPTKYASLKDDIRCIAE